jgi:sugar-phosphatase
MTLPSNIQGVAFDFDGLLMDSEKVWHDVEQQILKKHGILITKEESYKTSGLRCIEVVEHWINEKIEGSKESKEFYLSNALNIEREIEDRVSEELLSNGQAKAGAIKLLQAAMNSGLKYGIVSSSPKKVVIRSGLSRLGISSDEIEIFSALDEEYGKPHPAVYLRFLKKNNLNAQNSIAFEDSLNGSLAAKSAKMNLVSVPEAHSDRSKFSFADLVLDSLEEFDLKIFSEQ